MPLPDRRASAPARAGNSFRLRRARRSKPTGFGTVRWSRFSPWPSEPDSRGCKKLRRAWWLIGRCATRELMLLGGLRASRRLQADRRVGWQPAYARDEAADRRHNAVHSCSAVQRCLATSSHNARGLRASRSHAPQTKAAAERCGRPKRLTQYPWNSLIVNSTGSHKGPLICTTPVSAPC
jgi:hypothetical protein